MEKVSQFAVWTKDGKFLIILITKKAHENIS